MADDRPGNDFLAEDGLVARLAREACRRAFPDQYDLVATEMVPVVFSGLYQPVYDAVQSALTEAARVAREHACFASGMNACAQHAVIAAAIEALRDA